MGALGKTGIGGTLAVAASIGLMIAACGTVTPVTPAGPRTPAGGGPAAGASLSQPQQARADAAAILAAFTPPPAAVRLPAAPGAVVGGYLNHPGSTPGVQHLVDLAAWWRAPGTPMAALAYVKAHLPGRFKPNGESFGAVPPAGVPNGPGGPSLPDPYQRAGYTFAVQSGLPPLEGAQLLVDAARSASGQTYLRVDAQLAWTPARPAAEAVPAAAKIVTITATPDMNSPHDIPAPVTVTDPVKVRRIVALLDGLTLDGRGVHGCPFMSGKAITLAFSPHVGGPVLATAGEPFPSCGDVDFAIGGRRQPALSDYGSFAATVLAIAGAHWAGWNTPR
jgi:hypothetical protein